MLSNQRAWHLRRRHARIPLARSREIARDGKRACLAPLSGLAISVPGARASRAPAQSGVLSSTDGLRRTTSPLWRWYTAVLINRVARAKQELYAVGFGSSRRGGRPQERSVL